MCESALSSSLCFPNLILKQKKTKTKQLDFFNFQTFFFSVHSVRYVLRQEQKSEMRPALPPARGQNPNILHLPTSPEEKKKNTEQSRYTPHPQLCSQHYNLRIFYHLLKCASHVPHFTSFQSVSETADCSPV